MTRSISCPIWIAVAVVGLPMAAAAQAPSPTSVAVLPVKAEGLAKRNLAFLEEALVTAVAEHLDHTAMAAADVREALKPADLKLVSSCEAAGCWQKVGEKLSVAYVLVVEAVPAGKKLLLSLKLVEIGTKKIVARYQQPVDSDPTAYLAAAQLALTEVRQRAGLGGLPPPVPTAVAAAPPVLAATPAPAPEPTPAPAPTAAAIPEPPPAVEPVETPFDAKWPLPPPPATAADAKSLLPANQPLTHAGDAEWAEGIGFVRKEPVATNNTPGAAISAVSIPAVTGAALDENMLTLSFYRVSYGPLLHGVEALKPRAHGVEGRIRFMHEWRQANWFVAPWLDLQMFMGGGYVTTLTSAEARFASFHGMARFGLDVHPIPPESYRSVLAIGGFGGVRPRFLVWGVDKTDSAIQRRYDERYSTVENVPSGGDKDQNEFNLDKIYGGHARLRTLEHPGEPATFWIDGAYYRDIGHFMTAHYLSGEAAVNAGGMRISVHVIYRLGADGKLPMNRPGENIHMIDTMPEAFSMGIGFGGDV
jgi:hypothetical protein